jgi:hypothetical protein
MSFTVTGHQAEKLQTVLQASTDLKNPVHISVSFEFQDPQQQSLFFDSNNVRKADIDAILDGQMGWDRVSYYDGTQHSPVTALVRPADVGTAKYLVWPGDRFMKSQCNPYRPVKYYIQPASSDQRWRDPRMYANLSQDVNKVLNQCAATIRGLGFPDFDLVKVDSLPPVGEMQHNFIQITLINDHVADNAVGAAGSAVNDYYWFDAAANTYHGGFFPHMHLFYNGVINSNDHGYLVIVHELGHLLGLAHSYAQVNSRMSGGGDMTALDRKTLHDLWTGKDQMVSLGE